MQLTDRTRVPEAGDRPDRLAFKTAESQAGQMVSLDDAEGIVTAIVSVTGTVDEVNDIIVPGAYRETLVKRRPKVCWAHSWEHPIGRVLHIEELMPGDERLPQQTKDGAPWPAAAGALVATMQFNMRTAEGKQAFEAVRFYSESGECEYSIGYQVPPGRSTRDGAGTRHIKSLDLYELSVVLFGAHTMTGTISVKEAIAAALERKGRHPGTGTVGHATGPHLRLTAAETLTRARESKRMSAEDRRRKPTMPGTDKFPIGNREDLQNAIRLAGNSTEDRDKVRSWIRKRARELNLTNLIPESWSSDGKSLDGKTLPDFSDGVMIALYPDPAAADRIASAIAGTDETTPKEDLHVTLAYLGDTSTVDTSSDELVKIITEAVEGETALSGTVGGIGQFPAAEDDDGAPTWLPVDVPGLTLLRETVANALGDRVDHEHGFTPHITIGWDLGVIDPIPAIPVTFTSVHVVYGEQHREVPLRATPEEKSMNTRLLYLSVDEVAALTALDVRKHPGEAKAGGADRNRGNAEELRRYWTVGAGGAKIRWGTSGDFTRCVRLLSEHMIPERAKGYCANRHKEMTGMWPGDRNNKGYDPALDDKTAAPLPAAGKGYPRLPGSYEERADALMSAVVEALRGDLIDEDEGRWEWPGVCVDATFEDRVIATRHKYDGTDTSETFEMSYEFTPDGVDLGDPERVELQVVAVDVAETDVDGDLYLADDLPLAEGVYQIAHAIKVAHDASMEVKAGRVLSGSNERALRAAVERLVDVLASAGVKISLREDQTLDEADDDTTVRRSDPRKEAPPEADMTTTAPSANTKGMPIPQPDGTFVITRDDLDATLAAYLD